MAREVRRGSFRVGPDQASDPANPISRSSSFVVDDELGQGLGASELQVWRHSLFPIPIPDCSWEALPFDADIASPSGQEGQVMVSGTVCAVSLHNPGDEEELDWHVLLQLDAGARDAMVATVHEFSEHKGNVFPENDWPGNCAGQDGRFLGVFCELMVLDAYGVLGDGPPRLYSADVRQLFGLGGDPWGGEDGQWATLLRGQRVRLQGPFVWDSQEGHSGWWEIHPLDSLAFQPPGQPRLGTITWRIGAFSNSTLHDINACSRGGYLATPRRTVWYLDLPDGAVPASRIRVAVSEHVFRHGLEEGAIPDSAGVYRPPGSRYRNYRGAYETTPPPGVWDQAQFPVDPGDGKRKVRVSITMDPPDEFGGMLGLDVNLEVL